MEKFLLRAKVDRWSHSRQESYTTWAEGYLNVIALTNEGPKYAFAELVEDTLVWYIGTDWRYTPRLHHTYHEDTVGRYIGIEDKNGKKIFEGDIVRFHSGYAEDHWVGEVKYDQRNALFVFVGLMPCREVTIFSRDKSTFEVIGNKWDNPEALGEGEFT